MNHTNTQAVSGSEQPSRPSVWARIGIAAAMLAFCPSLLPLASANCGGAGIAQRLQTIPSIPGVTAGAPASANPALYTSNPTTAPSIVGLWKINFLSGGAIVDVAFDAWHSDGTEVLNDYTDPIEGNVCLGVWQQTGTRTFKLKHPSWYFDTTGTLQGTVIIHESISLSADGNSFSGPVVEDVYDVSGNLLEELSGQVKAMRMTAD